uniref:BHLH domain-containing protein n=1 Tax=Ascaris lumbricoides TaxID=6252 RepID=A0A0M3I2G1_ASCLU
MSYIACCLIRLLLYSIRLSFASEALLMSITTPSTGSYSLTCSDTPHTKYTSSATVTKQTEQVRRRNERERRRVHQVNLGYELLSRKVPFGRNKKLSKVETLRYAVQYIRYLRRQLEIDTAPAGNSNRHSILMKEEFFNETQSVCSLPSYISSSVTADQNPPVYTSGDSLQRF